MPFRLVGMASLTKRRAAVRLYLKFRKYVLPELSFLLYLLETHFKKVPSQIQTRVLIKILIAPKIKIILFAQKHPLSI